MVERDRCVWFDGFVLIFMFDINEKDKKMGKPSEKGQGGRVRVEMERFLIIFYLICFST